MTANVDILPCIAHISDNFQGILLDAYGVFWGGNDVGLMPGSKASMAKLVSEGKIVGILSNSTQLAAKEVNKLHLHGLCQGKHFHFLITSGEIARYTFLHEKQPFETPRKKFWLFGGPHPRFSPHEDIFQGTCYTETPEIDDADFAYISIPHIDGEDQVNPELFRSEVEKLKLKNLPAVCPNPDQFAHEGKPPQPVVRQGSIAKMYEEMGGQVFYIGKPHNKAFATAMNHFKMHHLANPSKILMVGDTPGTDIQGANRFGMPSALVLTGIMADRISKHGIQAALKRIPDQDTPTYLLQRL